METNLTNGPIFKTLTKLAVPIMASSFLGTLYNITDMAWIGLLGSRSVAGVGVGGQIESISWNTADGFGAALNAFVGQNYGAGKKGRNPQRLYCRMALCCDMGIADYSGFRIFTGNVSCLSETKERAIV